MRTTCLIVIALLTLACTSDHQNPELTYQLRASCHGNAQAIRDAAELWQAANVLVTEEPDGEIVVCAAKAGSYDGISNLVTGSMLINVTADNAVGTAAKHFGHALVGHHENLGPGVPGVMAAAVRDTMNEFTNSDVEFLRVNGVFIDPY